MYVCYVLLKIHTHIHTHTIGYGVWAWQGVDFPISPIDLRRRPYNTLALPSLSKNTFIFGSLSTCARRLYVQMNIWPALGRTLLRHDTKNNGHKYEAMYYLQLAYFICELALVPRLSPNIQKNCAFCDTSTKFGTNVH